TIATIVDSLLILLFYRSIYCLCSILSYVVLFFFFFQAEDGIRDGHVTGVQTCALPICWVAGEYCPSTKYSVPSAGPVPTAAMLRSEERRVGKECRSRWAPYD